MCNILSSSDGSSRHTFSRIRNEENGKRQSRNTVYDEPGFRTAMHTTVCSFAPRTQIALSRQFPSAECFVICCT